MSSTKIQQMLFERVIKEFGGDNFTLNDLNTRCGLSDMDLNAVKSTKTKEIPDEHKCCARIWDKDCDDKRCSKRRVDGQWFCSGHGKKMQDNTAGLEFSWQKCGRIDEPVPQGYRADKTVKKEKKSKKNLGVDGVTKPKKGLTAYFCFMNATRQQVKIENPGDKVGDIAKKLGAMWSSMGEEEKKPYQEMSAKDKERYQKEMEEFQQNKVEVAPIKVATPANDQVEDKVVEDKVVEEKVVEEKVAEEKVVEEKVAEEKVDEDMDDDEVAVVEFKHKGTTYLLDPDSNKLYNMEQEFVGKLEGKKINFDAVDSDDDE